MLELRGRNSWNACGPGINVGLPENVLTLLQAGLQPSVWIAAKSLYPNARFEALL